MTEEDTRERKQERGEARKRTSWAALGFMKFDEHSGDADPRSDEAVSSSSSALVPRS